MPLNLSTERLKLRPINYADAKMLWPYVSNPDISKDMSWQPHQNITETQEFINSATESMTQGKTITWCIFYNDRFCGIFSIISILKNHRALTYNRGELAYWAVPEFQGMGIMTEAGKKVIEYAFTSLGLNKLVVGHHVNNRNSEGLILRLGFKYHYTEEEVFMKNKQWITCKFYELKAKEYFKKTN